MAETLLNGFRVSFWGDENILEVDSGDDCTVLFIFALVLCAFGVISKKNSLPRTMVRLQVTALLQGSNPGENSTFESNASP